MIKLPVFTPTRLRMFQRCARQYAYVEIMGIRSPPNWAMVGGTAMDLTLNEHHAERISGKNSLVGSALTDYYRETLKTVVESNNLPKESADGDFISAETDGTRLLPIYEAKIDPILEPLEVQKTLEFTIPGNDYVEPFTMQGHVDLISRNTISTIIDDHKFTSRVPSQNACASSMQMWGYDYGYGDLQGREHHHTRLIHLVRRKREPDVLTTNHLVTAGNREDFLAMARTAAYLIQLGMFPPTEPGNIMVCSENVCGLWKYCRGRKEGMLEIPGEITFGKQPDA